LRDRSHAASGAKINPHAECIGQDIDARCAKITAINLGNALSGEARFAYRVAPFFHETPNGPRRGVIRDVPPEDTPVPVIAARTRREADDLFADQNTSETTETTELPTIIEIPRWLTALEHRRTASDPKRKLQAEDADGTSQQRPNEASLKQQTLF